MRREQRHESSKTATTRALLRKKKNNSSFSIKFANLILHSTLKLEKIQNKTKRRNSFLRHFGAFVYFIQPKWVKGF